MVSGAERHATSLRDHLRVVRRRKWVILEAALVLPAAALAFSLHQQKLYQASSQVLLSRQNLASSLTGATDPTIYVQADRLAQTQAEVARVPTIAERALRDVGLRGRTAQDFLRHSSVAAGSNTDILTFTVADAKPTLARRLADAYAREFTVYRRQLDTVSLVRARQSVQAKIAQLESSGDRHSALHGSLVDRDQQLATMEALQTANAFVVEQATDATRVQPKPVRNALLGFMLGLVLGLGIAFLWEALDTRVRSAEEMAERLGLPLLARIPTPPRRLRSKRKLVMVEQPAGAQAEAFRMLRTNLEFARLDRDVSTIMVTSAVEQEGKSTTIANLAVALARSGQRVALVDLDLRRPSLDRFFALEGPGLTQVALGRTRLDRALAPVPITDAERERVAAGSRLRRSRQTASTGAKTIVRGTLEVLPAGPLPPDPGEFVATRALGGILEELRERFDVVLIDAPPLLQVGDALALSSRVDAVVVAARMNTVRRGMLSEVGRLLATTPTEKLGFVLTGAGEEDGYSAEYAYGAGSYFRASRVTA